jgi:hypothetical protein
VTVEVWMNKGNANLYLVTPRWEPLTIDYDEKLFKEIAPELMEQVGERKLARGTLVQVGWLLENEHGVWLGVPLGTEEQFESLGEA